MSAGVVDSTHEGKTVRSEDFDISLMIYFLQTLANIKVSDLYPIPTDTSTSAMLSRIKYIRNETTQNLYGKLTEEQFNQYWDDIGQAILKLASTYTFAIENDQEDIRLIGRLLSISPININNRQLCTFIDVSEKYPAMILEQFISEYCMLKQVTRHDILREEKHRLYHKRLKTVSCCQCTTEFPIYSYSKCIPEKHWEALYQVTELTNSYNCKCECTPCIECFVPKRMITFDIFVAMTLILHIPNILKYFVSQLCVTGFNTFLMNNKHTIYHCMKKNMCCECNNDSTGKVLINVAEWNTLYIKEDAVYCKTGSEYCCCQYAVRNLIKYSDVDDTLLSKIFNVAGPLRVLNKVGQDTFFYFLNWTDDDQPLQKVLIELLNIIENKQLVRLIRSSILSKSNETITNQFDARKWISKHLKQQQAATDHQCQILVRDEDGLKVKSIDIPEDFPLPDVTKKFNDITPEENNFLLVFYWLTNMVYPVLKKVFDTKCPDSVLHKIWIEFSQANTKTPAKNYSDDDNRKKKRIYLTESQKQQLFPAYGKASRNINLKLMIHILKHISKEEAHTDDAHQLEAVENIRREIVQSSTGVLNKTRFLDIMNSFQKALSHFGGKLYVEKILQLCHIKRILVCHMSTYLEINFNLENT
ncbi:Hypothetical predicted protein [Mytilus galloprovincialis]|uniref:DZIP3-like HEPN domain-containing protein n=1 Tax=Mytilus galloprovincialis TaxID=29158 RepID=A0A8B6GDA5_MYTGA|nr:Hypothetical predicted protein [Mytilus galloprovincialis]